MLRASRVLGMCLCFASACGSDAKDDESGSWGGSEQHLSFSGTLEGEDFDVNLAGDAVSDALLSCTIEYELEAGKPETARVVEAKINALLEIGNQTRFLELELKYHDLTKDEIGDTISIVPRADDSTALAQNEMVCEWEWHGWDAAMNIDTDTVLEVSAQQGDVTLQMLEGLPATGIHKAGAVTLGATMDAAWSVDERMQLSFTAKCGEPKLTEI